MLSSDYQNNRRSKSWLLTLPEETLPSSEVGTSKECMGKNCLHTTKSCNDIHTVVVELPELSVMPVEQRKFCHRNRKMSGQTLKSWIAHVHSPLTGPPERVMLIQIMLSQSLSDVSSVGDGSPSAIGTVSNQFGLSIPYHTPVCVYPSGRECSISGDLYPIHLPDLPRSIFDSVDLPLCA